MTDPIPAGPIQSGPIPTHPKPGPRPEPPRARDTWQALGLLAPPRPGRRLAPRRVERAVSAAEPGIFEPTTAEPTTAEPVEA